MVQVTIWGSLATATGDQTEVEIDASTLRELLDGLAARYPALKPQLERGVSVAIDGRIYNDSWFTPIQEDSEVVLLARLKGG
ncbi:molybdopterin converting factor small subunit [Roseovarius halotolerans]|uniref:ThiS family protein n=1 Tax=Roseovarius halotolerans TaxID=505353 RepID=A0A1X6Y4V2_9RHOB|nr:MoaD/ThiS family protein [Roseovarius halotolerans]RKT35334.1 molybdopterin converting factor small subunit [Roseovarius halotolerans]SLN10722.1 ThiS family protein [Roseovarius halotolerans]